MCLSPHSGSFPVRVMPPSISLPPLCTFCSTLLPSLTDTCAGLLFSKGTLWLWVPGCPSHGHSPHPAVSLHIALPWHCSYRTPATSHPYMKIPVLSHWGCNILSWAASSCGHSSQPILLQSSLHLHVGTLQTVPLEILVGMALSAYSDWDTSCQATLFGEVLLALLISDSSC